MHPVSSYIITAYVTSSVFYSSREVNVAALTMECLQTNLSSTASAFENNELAYIHCVSKENFSVTLKGFTCVSLSVEKCMSVLWKRWMNEEELSSP